MQKREIYSREFYKIGFQFAYWATIFGFAIFSYEQGWINSKTQVPDSITHYLEERISLWLLVGESLVLCLIAGGAAIFGGENFVEQARDEISRLFYVLGNVSCGLAAFVGVYFKDWTYVIIAAAFFLAPTGIGFLVGTKLQPLQQSKQKNNSGGSSGTGGT
ncbi:MULTISPECIES: hypothetical protein [Burkholderia]|uniref:hypothetical protein n=1 Tax=Burkholderia TaxID=32008 RepID=UPI000F814E06|nr:MULTISPECIES: hypothetical protein [Burkholderia]MBU9433763.1 hypothetical protein [Burkholderia multivorans]MDN7816057.1 hypothetical protein [Burkholderia vietnamiensis]